MKRLEFGNDWSFCKKGGEARMICLPHDATQEEKREENAPSGSAGAFYPGGLYLYRKTFHAPKEWEGQEIFLEFEGVYPRAKVFLNGSEIGDCEYGYTLFRAALTGLAFGEENELLVEVDNSGQRNSRWYAGAGIYRPLYLLTGEKEHILPDGVRVTTRSLTDTSGDASTGNARILAEIRSIASAGRRIRLEIFDREKKISEKTALLSSAGSPDSGDTAADCAESTANIEITIPDARLWDAEHPYLYECRVFLEKERNGAWEVLDTERISFGIRTLEWSEKGFFVNGKQTLLKGGCVHHDNGILGARSFAQAEWRRIKKLKEHGFNAIRSAHNPICKEALNACDALGMYVMDEAWDMWYKAKTPDDYAKHFMEHYDRDLVSMVGKDFNHPSVILYSIGNEVTEPAKSEGVELAKKLVDRVHELDGTRPVTAGINLTLLLMSLMENDPRVRKAMGGDGENADETADTKEKAEQKTSSLDDAAEHEEISSTAYNQMVEEMGNQLTHAAARPDADQVSSPVLDLLDIAGYNYADTRYEMEKDLHPGRLIVGTETYTYDLARRWAMVEKLPYLIGDFMWTAWDYLGETGIGGWSYDAEDIGRREKKYPWLLSGSGALDILGNETAPAGAAAVTWGKRTAPYIAVRPVNHPGMEPVRAMWRSNNAMPYWSYQGCDGNEAKVEVNTKEPETELFINGRSVGRKKTEEERAEFVLAYEPGELKAVSYDSNGNPVSESTLRSADEHTRICILPEENCLPEDSLTKNETEPEILYLDISLRGENGEVECNRDTVLTISVENGELLAFGSANPKTEETFLSGRHSTWYGRSQAVVKAFRGKTTVTVRGDGLDTVTAAL